MYYKGGLSVKLKSPLLVLACYSTAPMPEPITAAIGATTIVVAIAPPATVQTALPAKKPIVRPVANTNESGINCPSIFKA